MPRAGGRGCNINTATQGRCTAVPERAYHIEDDEVRKKRKTNGALNLIGHNNAFNPTMHDGLFHWSIKIVILSRKTNEAQQSALCKPIEALFTST